MPEVGQWGPEPFIDRRGNALPNITVTVYESDGTTLATLYADQGGVTALANPLPTGVATTAAGVDLRGNGSFYAEPGPYVLAVVRNGSEVYRSPITIAADSDNFVESDDIGTIEVLTQAAYTALAPPDPTTLYVIVG